MEFPIKIIPESNILTSKLISSFRNTFGDRNMEIVIVQNPKSDNDPKLSVDFIIGIKIVIQKGNSYSVHSRFLNNLFFGIKKIRFSDNIDINRIEKHASIDYFFKKLRGNIVESLKIHYRIPKDMPIIYWDETNDLGDLSIVSKYIYSGKYLNAEKIVSLASLQEIEDHEKHKYLDKYGVAIKNIHSYDFQLLVEEFEQLNTKSYDDRSNIPFLVSNECFECKIPHNVLREEIQYVFLMNEWKFKRFLPYRKRENKENVLSLFNILENDSECEGELYIINASPQKSEIICSPLGIQVNVHYSELDFFNSSYFQQMPEQIEDIYNIAGNLSNKLSEIKKENVKYIIRIKGSINGSDLVALRDFSQDIFKHNSLISTIDLERSFIMSGGCVYFRQKTKYGTYERETDNSIISQFFFKDFYAQRFILPIKVDKIEKNAFFNNRLMQSVVINSGSIDRDAFSSCSYLKTIFISEKVKRISGGAFQKCENISEINVSQNTKFNIIDKCLYSGNKLLLFFDDEAEIFQIPNNITEICPYAFYGRKNLKSVLLNDNLKKIGDNAFGNTGITVFHIPVNVESIGKDIMPSILEQLYVYSVKPCPVKKYTFDSNRKATLHIPKDSIVNYKASKEWSIFADYIEEDYSALRYKDYYNKVVYSKQMVAVKKELKTMSYLYVDNIEMFFSFIDKIYSIKDFFSYDPSHFWLLVRRGKIELSNKAIDQLELLFPNRHREIMLLRKQAEINERERKYREELAQNEYYSRIEKEMQEELIELGLRTAFEDDPDAIWNID